MSEVDGDGPVVPAYGGACVTGVIPALVHGRAGGLRSTSRSSTRPRWSSWCSTAWAGTSSGRGARADAFGPWLGRITTVAPSTTATALTSITTGLAPGEHGVVGYRIDVDGEILNAALDHALR
ncbi:MAG: alkaline phosphatase family protein [Acidimicrobiales bacterium]